jgi:hypothetical protein
MHMGDEKLGNIACFEDRLSLAAGLCLKLSQGPFRTVDH